MSERKLKKLEKEYWEQLAQLEDPVKRLEVGSMHRTTLTYCPIAPSFKDHVAVVTTVLLT